MGAMQSQPYESSQDTITITRLDGSVVKVRKDEVIEGGKIKKAAHSVEEIGPNNEHRYWKREYDPRNPNDGPWQQHPELAMLKEEETGVGGSRNNRGASDARDVCSDKRASGSRGAEDDIGATADSRGTGSGIFNSLRERLRGTKRKDDFWDDPKWNPFKTSTSRNEKKNEEKKVYKINGVIHGTCTTETFKE